jgi:hypothetical protein
MNVDTGKISPQFHVIFDDKFETVVSMTSENLLGEQWRSFFCLGRECVDDVDYDDNRIAIIPPITSLFQQDDIADEIAPAAPWKFCNDNTDFPTAPTVPSVIPGAKIPASQSMRDFVPEGEAPHSVSVPEGGAPHSVSVPEGATTHDSNIPDALDKEVEKLKASTANRLPIAPEEWQG